MSAIVKDLKINARYDLQAPGVAIYYEQNNSVNGQSFLSIAEDFYPNPLPTDPQSQYGLLEFTVDIQGVQSSRTSASIKCDPIKQNLIYWWQHRHPEIIPWDPTNPADAENEIAAVSIDFTSFTRTPNPPLDATEQPVKDMGFTNELTTGQITSWMGFQSQRMTLTVNATVTTRKAEVKTAKLTYQCLTTNATTGSYNTTSVTSYAETAPTGLAQFIYENISVLQFEGSFILQEQDVSGQLLVGDIVNLSGGNLAEWTTMNAMVESVTENLDTGATTVEFGPVKSLNAKDLVTLLRINRARLIQSAYSMRITGDSGI